MISSDFLALTTKSLTVPSFIALAVLFPDYQNLTYMEQQNIALPFKKKSNQKVLKKKLPRLKVSRNIFSMLDICGCGRMDKPWKKLPTMHGGVLTE